MSRAKPSNNPGDPGYARSSSRPGPNSPDTSMRPQIRPMVGPPEDLNPRPDTPDLDTDEIRLRAYQIFLKRGGAGGNPEDDWLEAERQLRRESSSHGSLGRLTGY